MRAKEFTINVPITISINGDEDPIVSTTSTQPAIGQIPQTPILKPTPSVDTTDDSSLDTNPVMVTPLQQELELKKASLGKASPVIDKLTSSNSIGSEHSEESDISQLIGRIKALLSR